MLVNHYMRTEHEVLKWADSNTYKQKRQSSTSTKNLKTHFSKLPSQFKSSSKVCNKITRKQLGISLIKARYSLKTQSQSEIARVQPEGGKHFKRLGLGGGLHSISVVSDRNLLSTSSEPLPSGASFTRRFLPMAEKRSWERMNRYHLQNRWAERDLHDDHC